MTLLAIVPQFPLVNIFVTGETVVADTRKIFDRVASETVPHGVVPGERIAGLFLMIKFHVRKRF
jgi:hypothetical protein